MPDDVRRDYEEARSILQQSPRGACALLGLALQKLCDALGQRGKRLDKAIGSLVQNTYAARAAAGSPEPEPPIAWRGCPSLAGLPVEVQQALDVLRVVGNVAVHPGELDLRNDVDPATGLLTLVNFIAQDCIAQPKAIPTMFSSLPQGARDAVAAKGCTRQCGVRVVAMTRATARRLSTA